MGKRRVPDAVEVPVEEDDEQQLSPRQSPAHSMSGTSVVSGADGQDEVVEEPKKRPKLQRKTMDTFCANFDGTVPPEDELVDWTPEPLRALCRLCGIPCGAKTAAVRTREKLNAHRDAQVESEADESDGQSDDDPGPITDEHLANVAKQVRIEETLKEERAADRAEIKRREQLEAATKAKDTKKAKEDDAVKAAQVAAETAKVAMRRKQLADMEAKLVGLKADRFADRERSPLHGLHFTKRQKLGPPEGDAVTRDQGVGELPELSGDFVRQDERMDGAEQADP